jgi:hypothetical protein
MDSKEAPKKKRAREDVELRKRTHPARSTWASKAPTRRPDKRNISK